MKEEEKVVKEEEKVVKEEEKVVKEKEKVVKEEEKVVKEEEKVVKEEEKVVKEEEKVVKEEEKVVKEEEKVVKEKEKVVKEEEKVVKEEEKVVKEEEKVVKEEEKVVKEEEKVVKEEEKVVKEEEKVVKEEEKVVKEEEKVVKEEEKVVKEEEKVVKEEEKVVKEEEKVPKKKKKGNKKKKKRVPRGKKVVKEVPVEKVVEKPHLEYGTILEVPFYVYDELDWMSMTINGEPIHDNGTITHKTLTYVPKHLDDFYFTKFALQHPMRTMDPEKAKLFVVPGFLNMISERELVKFFDHNKGKPAKLPREDCCIGKICRRALIQAMDTMLNNSEWFNRRSGADHIVVASHYFRVLSYSKNLAKCSVITFENWDVPQGKSVHIPSTYTGVGCPHEEKTHDITFIGSTQAKNIYRFRKKVCKVVGRTKGVRSEVCGKGLKCPTLARSKFGFHFAGDTPGSNRLIDTILSGTIPVFTHPLQYGILPEFIPWRNFSVYVEANPKTFREGVVREGILRLTWMNQTEYNEKRDFIIKNRNMVDWESGVPFELYMNHFYNELVLRGVIQGVK